LKSVYKTKDVKQVAKRFMINLNPDPTQLGHPFLFDGNFGPRPSTFPAFVLSPGAWWDKNLKTKTACLAARHLVIHLIFQV